MGIVAILSVFFCIHHFPSAGTLELADDIEAGSSNESQQILIGNLAGFLGFSLKSGFEILEIDHSFEIINVSREPKDAHKL